MSSTFPSRCWAEIDLRALEANVRRIRQALPPNTHYISVVKADSYGVGVKQVIPHLKSAGVGTFAVANVAEGAEVRRIDPESPILLLSATVPEEDDYLFEYELTPTISSVEEVRRYQEAARRLGLRLPVHLKLDTGMGRLGMWHERAEELFAAVSAAPLLEVRGLYSHFASAGEDHEFTDLQRRHLLRSLERHNDRTDQTLVHIDNSAGLASHAAGGPFNAVRIGLLQFGILPVADSRLARFNVSPVLSLHSRVSVVKELPKGTGISYGSTRILGRDSRTAIIAAGYADGILRACSNRGNVLVRGRRCPVLGNVTMDEIIVDVTDVPGVTCGDLATFIGRQKDEEIAINEYSDWCGTIPWEVLCALSKRVARVYV